MDLQFKIKYFTQIRKRYYSSRKKDKTIILNELCKITGLSRKHVIRALALGHFSGKKASGRSKIYSDEAVYHLKKLWHILGHICSKKMVSALPLWIKYYEPDGFTDKIKDEILSMSSPTIDRYLKAYKAQYARKKRTGTRRSKKFANIIPIKDFEFYPKSPGYLQADTVAHCGNSLSGKFVWTLTITDEHSGWTENRAFLGKDKTPVLEAVADILWRLPFKPISFNSDNGNEFVNKELYNYISADQKINFTRSSAYRKNDNAHVEQKNFTHVREVFGYERFDTEDLSIEMNVIYKECFNLLQNFFIPQIKTKELKRIGSKYVRKCDSPKTPFERLMESKDMPLHKKIDLQKRFDGLNPIELKKRLDSLLSNFNKKLSEFNDLDEVA